MEFMGVIVWWLGIGVLGVILLPLTSRLFDRFGDRGYLFSKSLGILVFAYMTWLLSSLRVLPFAAATQWLVVIVSAVGVYSFKSNRQLMAELLSGSRLRRKIVFEELLFLTALFLWSYVRAMKPEVDSLEKFMDLGFVNTIFRTSYMPPMDMWSAGAPINYYYFGQYITAYLSKLTGVSTYIAYNLMMATIFAFALSLGYSIVYNLARTFRSVKEWMAHAAGAVSGILLAFAGNLHYLLFGFIVPFLKNNGVTFREDLVIRDEYWFTGASRYIGHNPPIGDRLIHEFPIYSFIVSDLHAHVINIIFVLTVIGLILAVFLRKSLDRAMFLSIGFVISMFTMTNFWDVPVYLTVLFITLLYIHFIEEGFKIQSVFKAIVPVIAIYAMAQILTLPFNLNFMNFSNGVGLTPTHSQLYQLLVIWGHFLVFFLINLILVTVFKEERNTRSKVEGNWLTKWIRSLQMADAFGLILGFCAVGLVMITEIVYVKDIYPPPNHRANTVFKLTYQSFMLFALSSGFVFAKLLAGWKKYVSYKVMTIICGLIIIFPIMYGFYATKQWYGDPFKQPAESLDIMHRYAKEHPGEYEVIMWLNERMEGPGVILEANGDSYTRYGRISMGTGLQTPIGWYVHEWLWHNSAEWVMARNDHVRQIYTGDDVTRTKELIKEYGIEYIVVGDLEFEKYPDTDMDKLLTLGKVAFQRSDITVIDVDEMTE